MAAHMILDDDKTMRENLFDWVGDDDRMNAFFKYCDSMQLQTVCNLGNRWCSVDLVLDNGKVLHAPNCQHTMTIDIDLDTVIIMGEVDYQAGIERIREFFSHRDLVELEDTIDSLSKL